MTNGFKLVQRFKFEEAGSENGEGAQGASDGNAPDPKNKGGAPQGDNGGNKPTDREAELLREVMEKKDKIRSLSETVESLKTQLSKYDGINVDEVKALLQERQERERAELEKRGEFDRVKQQMIEEHKTQLTKLQQQMEGKVQELSAQLESANSMIRELTIGRAFSESSFVRDTLTLTPSKARVVYGSHFEVQDGKVVAYDKPAGEQNRTVLVDAQGEPLPFDQAIEKIVRADPDHDHLVRSTVKPGSNSRNDPGAKPESKVGKGRDRIGAAIASGALQKPVIR